jgi:hypothetical protein
VPPALRKPRETGRQEFFFEKKNQKTFSPALSRPDVPVDQGARTQTGKSFLVLFLKKNAFFAFGSA